MNLKIAKDRKMRTFDGNGHLLVESTIITKAGVNEYLGNEIVGWEELGLESNKIYRILRDPSELEKSIDTFKSLQLMIKHIEVGADNPEKEYTIGALGSEISFDGEDVTTSLRVWDGDAIRLIQSGKLEELSAGYYYSIDMQKGEYNGEQYDGIMRNIHGNHVALVYRGRIGRDATIKDSLPDQLLGQKMKLKKGAYSKIAERMKKSLAMDEDIPLEKLEDIVEAVLDEVPEVAEDEDKKDDEPTNDSDDGDKNPAEDEDEKDDKKKPAMDEDAVRRQVFEEARQAHEAVEQVRPLVGSVAFDSAENVYRKALKQSGVSYSGNDIEAMKLLVSAKIESKSSKGMASDSAPQNQPQGEKPKAFQRIK